MRPVLGLLLALTLLLTGCGSDDGTTPDQDTAGDTGTATPPADGPVEFTQVALVAESAVGGQVAPEATVLDDRDAVTEFASRFDDQRMAGEIADALADADVPDGQVVVAAVVAVACDAPTSVSVERAHGELLVTAPPVKTDKQCLVPVTTVALVAVDAAAA